MGLSAKKSKKMRKSDSDSDDYNDMEFEEMEQEKDDFDDDDYGEEDEEEQGEEEEDGEEGTDEEDQSGWNNDEMEQLEKEYRDLHHQELFNLKNLKHHKDEDLLKGQAVKSQKALWYKILELRFLLQKPFSSSNRLPQDPVKSSFCEADENVRVAYSDLITSSKETLDSILELQEDITNQVAAYMRDPSRMIKQMRLRKSTVSVFESVAMEDLETLYAETNAYALASHIFWALWALIQIQLLNINLHHVMMIVNEIMTLNVEFE